jgi:DNA-directed RNA polymerase subunit RPC12/RpoP
METRCDWIDETGGQMELKCSNCGKILSSNVWLEISEDNGDGPNYCPHCGAKSNLQIKE